MSVSDGPCQHGRVLEDPRPRRVVGTSVQRRKAQCRALKSQHNNDRNNHNHNHNNIIAIIIINTICLIRSSSHQQRQRCQRQPQPGSRNRSITGGGSQMCLCATASWQTLRTLQGLQLMETILHAPSWCCSCPTLWPSRCCIVCPSPTPSFNVECATSASVAACKIVSIGPGGWPVLRRSGNIKTEGDGEGAWHSVDVGLQHNACKILSINC